MLTEAKFKFWNSAHLLAVSFLCVIILGAIILKYPLATHSGITFIDALFTAVSAVCVTGLITVHVSLCFTQFGQIIILLLIQVGGLGIMTFAAFILWIVRQKISLNDRMALEYSFIQGDKTFELRDFIFFIVRYTFMTEFIGALCLFFSFQGHHKIGEEIFFAIFHSVSSFSNAGFSLYSDNFIRYCNSIPVNLITCILVIFGGIGFIVVFELRNCFYNIIKKKKHKFHVKSFSLHTWMVLMTTFILIIVGSTLIYFFEHISGNSSISILESFFQSVASRTAGFNSIHIGNLHKSTLLIIIFLMFIGGSTAGGIKTTTFAVLIFIMLLGKNNFEDVTARNRTIPKKIIFQALIVLLFSLAIVFFSILLICIFEPNITFINLLFETVSAFGTVGLSSGITSTITINSKWVLMMTMFASRVGSLTIFSIFMNRNPGVIKYTEERIIVG